MIEVDNPKVYLVGQPSLKWEVIREYLEEIGGGAWLDKVLGQAVPHDSELLVEIMGRLCYKSWEPGLNHNVTKVREDHGDYLLNVLRSGHGSVLEHAVFNFIVHDASRVLTAELNRHRAGVAISEQSLRYVRLDQDLRFRLPRGVLKPETIKLMEGLIWNIESCIGEMYELEGIDSMEAFADKKAVTSAIRRAAPLGLATEEGWSANVREIRHVITMRSAAGAEEEIRVFADQLAQIMQSTCPLLFGDYEQDPFGSWVTDNRKV